MKFLKFLKLNFLNEIFKIFQLKFLNEIFLNQIF